MMSHLVPKKLVVLGLQDQEPGAPTLCIQHGPHKVCSAIACLGQNSVAQAHLHPQKILVQIWTHFRYQTLGKLHN